MGSQDYGYAIAAVWPILSLVLSILVYIKRNNAFIRCRNPFLLVMQNIGSTTCVVILSLWIPMRPNFSCSLFYAGYLFNYSLFMVPILMRCWQYCVNYHISLLKLQYRSSFFVDWKKSSWFFRHKWVGSPSFLYKLLPILLIMSLLPGIPAYMPDKLYHDDSTLSCRIHERAVIYAATALSVFVLVSALVMAILILHAKDVYGVKFELYSVAGVWILCSIGFNLYVNPIRTSNKYFDVSNFVLFANTYTLFACNAFPLWMGWQFEKWCRGEHAGTPEVFRRLLENPEFRNVFHDFLSKQFCQENLQFYEVVTHWRELPLDDPKRNAKLRSIMEAFVDENGVCQVDMQDYLRTRVIEDANRDPPPPTLFDDALDALILDMYTNSFLQFVRGRRTNRDSLDSFASSGLSSTGTASSNIV